MHDSSWLSLQVGIILTENCWDCRRKNLRRIIIAAAVASLPNYLQFLRAFERPPRLKTQLLERLARTQWNQRGFKVRLFYLLISYWNLVASHPQQGLGSWVQNESLGRKQTVLLSTDWTPRQEMAFTEQPKIHSHSQILGTTKAYFVCHIGTVFQISLIYAFIGCP